jgi:hypothetical protein
MVKFPAAKDVRNFPALRLTSNKILKSCSLFADSASRALSIRFLPLEIRARWLFLRKKPLDIPGSVKTRIENAVVPIFRLNRRREGRKRRTEKRESDPSSWPDIQQPCSLLLVGAAFDDASSNPMNWVEDGASLNRS